MENGYTIKVTLWNRSGAKRERNEQEDGISFETINVRAKYEHAQSSFEMFGTILARVAYNPLRP